MANIATFFGSLVFLVAVFSTRVTAQNSCQTLVFSGLSTRCNLDGTSEQTTECCVALDEANDKRCFCESTLMNTITLVIGEQGVNFFREFAKTNCSGALIEGRACTTAPPASTQHWNVTAPPASTTPINYNQHREQTLYESDVRGSLTRPTKQQTTLRFFGDGASRPSAESQSVAEYVFDPRRDNEIGFTADALALTGLRDTLGTDNQALTMFVPVNNAWYTLLILFSSTKAELFDDDTWLKETLRYHVVAATEGAVRTQSMEFGTKLYTTSGAALHFEKFYERRSRTSSPAIRVNGCSIHPTRRDIEVQNGVVHYIDCVLLPKQLMLPTRRTLISYISSRAELSMFYNALRGTALMERLEQRDFEEPLTIFAPNNDAFIRFISMYPAFYIDTFEERWANPESPTLYETLMYHVVLGRFLTTDLSASQTPDALMTDLGQRVFVETHRSTNVGRSLSIFVNGCELVAGAGEALTADGVVHQIDCVLVPDFDDSMR